MRKIKNSKGFTLMEMLIVVAIIAILIAIAIPTFTSTLEKTREAADLANIRSAYAEAMVTAMTGNSEGTAEVTITQMDPGFADGTDIPSYLKDKDTWSVVTDAKKGEIITVTVKTDGTVSYKSGSSSSNEG